MEISKVKKYECLFTKDINKKNNKKWNDGIIRIHHSNSKAYLLSTDFAVISECFYRSNKFHTSTVSGGKGGSSLSPEFQLKEGELIEFNDIWLAEIVDLIEVRETNLTELRTATQETRKTNSKSAQTWALEHDKSISSPKPQSRPSPSTSKPPPSNAVASTSTSNYKGFSIAPPRSYHDPNQNTKAKSNALIRPISGGKGRVVPHPYARNSPLSNSTTHNQNQHRAASNAGTPSRPSSSLSLHSTPTSSSASASAVGSAKDMAKEFKSPYTISTPSKATGQAFKPPSFLRNVVAGARFSPDLNLRRSTDGEREEVRKTALERGTLDLDWERFGGKK